MRDEDINEGWYPRVARFLAGTSEDNRGEVRLQGRPLPTDVNREPLVKASRRVAHALAAAAGNRLEHQRQRCEQEARGRATILLMSTALVQSFRINLDFSPGKDRAGTYGTLSVDGSLEDRIVFGSQMVLWLQEPRTPMGLARNAGIYSSESNPVSTCSAARVSSRWTETCRAARPFRPADVVMSNASSGSVCD